MKKFKRNAVIVTIILFVCVAVYLNWSYSKGEDAAMELAQNTQEQPMTATDESSQTTESGAGLYYEGDGVVKTGALTEYFDKARLTRQQARDEATETLQTVSMTEGASQESVDTALQELATMADWMVKEAELENLVIAKGYEDCVVYISKDGVTVTVPTNVEGLSTAEIARITDTVTGNTDYTAADLKIIEIK